MSNGSNWYQVWRGDAKGKLLEILDPRPRLVLDLSDDAPKEKLVVGYARYNTEGSHETQLAHQHFLDLDAARLLAWDLLTKARGEAGRDANSFLPIWQEFKGGAARNVKIPGVENGMILSRKFTVTYQTHLKGEALRSGPVYRFEFVVAEGETGDKGQVLPKAGGRQFLAESINLPLPAARRLGITVLQYLQARDAAAHMRLPLD